MEATIELADPRMSARAIASWTPETIGKPAIRGAVFRLSCYRDRPDSRILRRRSPRAKRRQDFVSAVTSAGSEGEARLIWGAAIIRAAQGTGFLNVAGEAGLVAARAPSTPFGSSSLTRGYIVSGDYLGTAQIPKTARKIAPARARSAERVAVRRC